MNLRHRLNLVVTKDYHTLWPIYFLFLLKNVEIHFLEEEVVLVLCGQVACMLKKYLIKKICCKFDFYIICIV